MFYNSAERLRCCGIICILLGEREYPPSSLTISFAYAGQVSLEPVTCGFSENPSVLLSEFIDCRFFRDWSVMRPCIRDKWSCFSVCFFLPCNTYVEKFKRELVSCPSERFLSYPCRHVSSWLQCQIPHITKVNKPRCNASAFCSVVVEQSPRWTSSINAPVLLRTILICHPRWQSRFSVNRWNLYILPWFMVGRDVREATSTSNPMIVFLFMSSSIWIPRIRGQNCWPNWKKRVLLWVYIAFPWMYATIQSCF